MNKTPLVWQKLENRTVEFLIKEIYNRQKNSSKFRGHNLPDYSYEDLLKWVIVQPNFKELFDNWINSNCQTSLIPSVDREDDSIGYTLSNLLRITTWKENKRRGEILRGQGISKHKRYKEVHQFDFDGNYINTFHSALSASKTFNMETSANHIIEVCEGIRNYVGEYTWSYDNKGRDIPSKLKYIKEGSLRSIPVCGFKGDTYVEFSSATSAMSLPYIQQANILKVLKGERKTSGGYSWRLLIDYLSDIISDIENTERSVKTDKIEPSNIIFDEETSTVSIKKSKP